MKIAIMGAGAIGGWLAVRLAENGHSVNVIARGEHLAAINKNGLALVSPHGDGRVVPDVTTSDPTEIGVCDLIIFAVKLYDAETATKLITPMIGLGTKVLSFLNGIDGVDILSEIIEPEQVMGGSIMLAGRISKPGVVEQVGPMQYATIGEVANGQTVEAESIHSALTDCGLDTILSNQIQVEMWQKFVMFCGWGAISALARVNAGTVRLHPELADLVDRSITEVAMVARAASVPVGDDCESKALTDVLEKLPASAQASLLTDLQAGRKMELPWTSGTVVRLGNELSVPTPVHSMVLSALSPYISGRQKHGSICTGLDPIRCVTVCDR